MSMKNSSDNVGNRTRDVPACNAVPQPTAPPRAPREGPKKGGGEIAEWTKRVLTRDAKFYKIFYTSF